IIIDTLAFPPDFVKKNPQAVKGVLAGWFDALDLVRQDPAEANRIMGADVKQSAEDFAASAACVTWYDRTANKDYFAKTMKPFMTEATEILLESGVIKKAPELGALADSSFLD